MSLCISRYLELSGPAFVIKFLSRENVMLPLSTSGTGTFRKMFTMEDKKKKNSQTFRTGFFFLSG